MSNQEKIWNDFSQEVENHLEKYVIPQWGDAPDDQISQYDENDIKANLMRYVGRIGRGQRGFEESQRDWLKIAHYASRGYDLAKKSSKK